MSDSFVTNLLLFLLVPISIFFITNSFNNSYRITALEELHDSEYCLDCGSIVEK